MRSSVSEARSERLVTNMAPVAAKSARKLVIFNFMVRLLSIISAFVFQLPVTLGDAPVACYGV
jgi:hypothetical protein